MKTLEKDNQNQNFAFTLYSDELELKSEACLCPLLPSTKLESFAIF